jgi:circadian clock protein KaiB
MTKRAMRPAEPKKPPPDEVTDVHDPAASVYYLRLYVAGGSPTSVEAFINLKALCETYLAGRYEIEVIDLLEFPGLAGGAGIIAVPTLVRRLPKPTCMVIGDLSDIDRVLAGLQLPPRER